MSDLDLMRVLAAATAALAAPDADPGVLDRVLANVPAQAGLACRMRLAPDGLRIDWQRPPTEPQEAFADVLAQVVQLAVAAAGQESPGVVDPAGFAAAVERGVAAARWRGGRVSIAIFDVYGLLLGPGIDESGVIARVGSLARSAVRQNDIVGHLGAARFALLLPGGGSFEARSAFKRVRKALSEAPEGVECGAAGFAELAGDVGTAAELVAAAAERQAEARRRLAYLGPGDPLHPLAG
ncbi:MAG TPA: hypothetical protein VFQ71_09225 [Gaiellales bacterium]|nr:hypothetical protein [Gaiellales bacterium]